MVQSKNQMSPGSTTMPRFSRRGITRLISVLTSGAVSLPNKSVPRSTQCLEREKEDDVLDILDDDAISVVASLLA